MNFIALRGINTCTPSDIDPVVRAGRRFDSNCDPLRLANYPRNRIASLLTFVEQYRLANICAVVEKCQQGIVDFVGKKSKRRNYKNVPCPVS